MCLATIMPGYLLGAKPFPEPNLLTHICVSPGYLLGAKPFPWPMLIYPPGFIFNYIHNEHELDPNLCVFYGTLWYQQTSLWPLNLPSPNRKQTDIVLCTMNSQRQDSCSTCDQHFFLRSDFASGHRVALVVNRGQKSVPESASEWPTFSPAPLEICLGTANVDGQNSLVLMSNSLW